MGFADFSDFSGATRYGKSPPCFARPVPRLALLHYLMRKVQLRSHLKKKEAIRLPLMGLFSQSKTFEQPMNRSDINHALAVFGPVFQIFAEAAISAKPGKTALHDPAKRYDFKAF